MEFPTFNQNRLWIDFSNPTTTINQKMNSPLSEIKSAKIVLSLLLVLGLSNCFLVSQVLGQEQAITSTTDLSNVDWSDEPTEETKKTEDYSNMSWEDEAGDEEAKEDSEEASKALMAVTEEEEKALEDRERRIHILGFILFVGYLVGGTLTAYFTRNRKLAIDYPPELLILLHTVWPLEWVFLTFAGKKVR